MLPDVEKLFVSDFDRDGQLHLIASTLEHLRSAFPQQWKQLGAGEKVPEFKKLVRSLVRVADESNSHRSTVAYASRAALDELATIASSRNGARRITRADLNNGKKFRHEHATPVEVIVRTITLPENTNVAIVKILKAVCCRILVTLSESASIDIKHAWTVPASLTWKGFAGFGVRTLKPGLLPLVRYYEINQKLALTLVPMSSEHFDLHRRFRALVTSDNAEDVLKEWLSCRPTADEYFYLSDEIYTGRTR
ncbi:MAG: hypothetical protein J0I65_00100 [Variovorax sp.]|nr:hypothetical protein [Variovorax sp.]